MAARDWALMAWSFSLAGFFDRQRYKKAMEGVVGAGADNAPVCV